MTTFTLSEAKAKFSEVLDKVAGGEEFVITRMGKPVARISQFEAKKAHKRLGFMRGKAWMAEDYDNWPEVEARASGITD